MKRFLWHILFLFVTANLYHFVNVVGSAPLPKPQHRRVDTFGHDEGRTEAYATRLK